MKLSHSLQWTARGIERAFRRVGKETSSHDPRDPDVIVLIQ